MLYTGSAHCACAIHVVLASEFQTNSLFHGFKSLEDLGDSEDLDEEVFVQRTVQKTVQGTGLNNTQGDHGVQDVQESIEEGDPSVESEQSESEESESEESESEESEESGSGICDR